MHGYAHKFPGWGESEIKTGYRDMAGTQLKHDAQVFYEYTFTHVKCINIHINYDKENLSTQNSTPTGVQGLHAHTHTISSSHTHPDTHTD